MTSRTCSSVAEATKEEFERTLERVRQALDVRPVIDPETGDTIEATQLSAASTETSSGQILRSN